MLAVKVEVSTCSCSMPDRSAELTRGRALVLLLVHLVGDGTKTTGDTVGDGVVAGNVALGLLLVGLLGSLSRL